MFYRILKSQYGEIYQKPKILKHKEKKLNEIIIEEIKKCYKGERKEDPIISRFNPVRPYLYYKISFIYTKTIISK